MKRYSMFFIVLGLWSFCLSCPFNLNISEGSEIQWNGYLLADDRLYVKDDMDFSWQEYRLDLKTEGNPAQNTHFYSELWLRSIGFPAVQESSDLIDEDIVSPLNVDMREAYVDLYGFLFNDLDIRIGRQRIAWGTADKLNPTDNLNPDDLEDIWDFGRHLGSDGLQATYYLGDFTFTGVYIPIFTPAVLPGGDWASALSPSLELPPGLTLGETSDTIILPENNLKDSSTIAVKIATYLFGYDFSLSYVYGRDDLPLATKVILTPASVPGEADVASELMYTRMHIVGMDCAGAIAVVGIWAEAGIFFPEKVTITTDLSGFGMGIQETTALDNNPYIKYVVGADYTFKNGVYINGQFLHGFIHERGKDNLEDYFMFGMEKKLFSEKLKISPISGGVEIKDLNNIKNNYALIFSPEITYYPFDSTELVTGLRIIEGTSTTTFGKVKDNDELYFKAKYSF